MRGVFGRNADLGPFTVFVVLYATAFLLQRWEFWRDPVWAAGFTIGAVALFFFPSRLNFLLYLAVATVFEVLWKFPDVPNHANVMMFVNLALIGGLAYSLIARPGDDGDAFYNMVQPVLRLMVVATLFSAGFHKLNRDFIDPEVSCLARFLPGIKWAIVADAGFGIPIGVLVAAMVAAWIATALANAGRVSVPAIDWAAIAPPAAAAAVLSVVFLAAFGAQPLATPKSAVFFFAAVAILGWQLIEGPLLLLPRFQWVALVLSLLVHAQLALYQLTHFQSLMVALLVAFVPGEVWQAWRRRAACGIGRLAIHRAGAYFLLNLAGGLLMLWEWWGDLDLPHPRFVPGVFFIAAVLVMLWPILRDLLSSDRAWQWRGVRVLNGRTPRFLFAVPVLLVAFAMTSYLGLRTAGNLSMFSNLRTEGAQSNHLLLGSNPLKVAGYQEDVIEIIDTHGPGAGGLSAQYSPGHKWPVVEFKKNLRKWRRSGRQVGMTLRYRGAVIRSDDIAGHPDWRVDRPNWEMRLMQFRVIGPEEKNLCRW